MNVEKPNETVDVDAARRSLLIEINSRPRSREELEQAFGQVWSTDELTRDFVVTGFLAPIVVVRRRSDEAVGSLHFQHSPRFYFSFALDER
jgi:hypothetical protein